MIERRVLVVGATGQLGRVIVSKLLAAGVPVRALARGRDKLADLATAGAEVMAADMLDAPAMAAACGDVDQVVATANNNMGRGVTSPRRVDVRGYQNLCEAARRAGVRRLLYTSFRGASPDTGVDIFTLKWQIEDVVRRSGVPWVLVRPSAFVDTWANEVLGGGIRKNGVTMIFGDGRRVCNYVTVADVAEFVVRILARDDVQNEVIEIGGRRICRSRSWRRSSNGRWGRRGNGGTFRSRRCKCCRSSLGRSTRSQRGS